MRIIKEGNLNFDEKLVRFECEKCGCIFEATKDEYIQPSLMPAPILSDSSIQEYKWFKPFECKCKCPYCGKMIYIQ